MSRPRKCRRVCHYPLALAYQPEGGAPEAEFVTLTLDEYETLRLMDREGVSQEECGARMGVARTTVQQIYASARKKIADALTEGRPFRIQGGDYRLCRGELPRCGGCLKDTLPSSKGENTMKIAVTHYDGLVFQHFGHTPEFKVYEVADGKILSSQVVSTGESGHGALAAVLSALDAGVLICGGIGGGARNALAAAGIQVFGGVSGPADNAVAAYLAGRLDYDPNARCSHHDHEHGHDHTCGDHGCGSHGNDHTCGSHGCGHH